MRYVKRPMTIAPGMIDSRLAILAVMLSLWGLLMVFSASPEISEKNFGAGNYFGYTLRQAKFIVAGIGLMFATAFIDYHRYESRRLLRILFAVTVVALIAVHFPPFGQTFNNASRWLQYKSIRCQPAEFAKITMVILIAAQIARRGEERMRSFLDGVFPVMLFPALISVLILLQNDLGSVVVIMGVAIFLIYIGGAKIKHLGLAGMAAAAFGVAAILISPKRITRILTWFIDEPDFYGSGWQIGNSKIAFGSGHIFGCGLTDGLQKLSFLPEIHKEFILANVGEEFGFVGVVATLALFTILVVKGLVTAKNAGDPLGRYIAFGASCVLGLEVLINTYVVLDLIPNKGMAMPFLSYGGSSLVASFILAGLILSVSRWTEKDIAL